MKEDGLAPVSGMQTMHAQEGDGTSSSRVHMGTWAHGRMCEIGSLVGPRQHERDIHVTTTDLRTLRSLDVAPKRVQVEISSARIFIHLMIRHPFAPPPFLSHSAAPANALSVHLNERNKNQRIYLEARLVMFLLVNTHTTEKRRSSLR